MPAAAYLMDPICVDNWDNCQQYRRLYRFRLFRGRHYRLKAWLPHLLFAAALLLVALSIPPRAFTVLVYTLAGFAILLYLGYLAVARVVPDGECLRAAAPRDSFCRYVFGNGQFQVVSGRDRHALQKAALAVEKGLFTAGTPEALRRFLAEELGPGRYIVVEGPPLREETGYDKNKGADF